LTKRDFGRSVRSSVSDGTGCGVESEPAYWWRAGDVSAPAKPFVRWLGGKRRLAARVVELLGMPPPGARYFEPFVGSGAVFFHLRSLGWPGRAVLCDVNADLIALYRAIRDDVEELIAAFDGVTRDKDLYLALRSVDPDTLGPIDRAARTYYLNRCAFNGVWRVNRAGGYNVPYAALKGPLVDVDALRAASSAFQFGEGTELVDEPYWAALYRIQHGDRVYFDPPYLGTFSAYSSRGWDEQASRMLERRAESLQRVGARIVVSLPDVPEERETWSSWELVEVEERRSVAANGSRKPAACMLAVGGTV
jgi:DNA adenine methylase